MCSSDLRKLKFVGVFAIQDDIREGVKESIEECIKAGIAVKIVTGDNPGTAKEIGRKIGLWTETDSDKNIITGTEMAKLSDKQLEERVMDIKIIARARPMDKKRLVEALQNLDQVVAVTGDGTNDAPALNKADVGLAMGNGTQVAKDASDMIIQDNSFSTIANAVMWGRSLYKNIQRFLLFQLTVNVAACFLVLFGAFLGTESPLTVTQMLWVNLIMDTFAAIALSALPPQKSVMDEKPRDPKAFILDKSMLHNIFGVGGFFFLMLLVLLIIFQHTEITSMKDLLNFSFGERSHVTTYELTLLFTISCLYHAFRWGSTVKRVFRRFDYSSIYLLIGGTFAPMFLVYWGDRRGIFLFIVQWVIIVSGITLVGVFGPSRFRTVHMVLYVAIGWSGLMFLPDMLHTNPPLFWYTLMGGVIYTLGIIPFAIKVKGSHFIWHFFVLAGALCQWLGIYRFLFLS
mgnify:CR=1 FL=1